MNDNEIFEKTEKELLLKMKPEEKFYYLTMKKMAKDKNKEIFLATILGMVIGSVMFYFTICSKLH